MLHGEFRLKPILNQMIKINQIISPVVRHSCADLFCIDLCVLCYKECLFSQLNLLKIAFSFKVANKICVQINKRLNL